MLSVLQCSLIVAAVHISYGHPQYPHHPEPTCDRYLIPSPSHYPPVEYYDLIASPNPHYSPPYIFEPRYESLVSPAESPHHYPVHYEAQPHNPPYVPSYLPSHPGEDPEIFPEDFSFGITSGAYHIEGAWDEDGKSESIWDRWLHSYPGVVIDHTNGDYASDALGHMKEDVEIMNSLSIRHFRFSIAWTRILVDGSGKINQRGIDVYKKAIQLLRFNQIEPIITLYHGDLPQALQDQGGFLCESFIGWFTNYAKVVFDHFGNDVKYWITFNDPGDICKGGYGDGTYAPGINDRPGYNEYVCGYYLLRAHAAVYHLYDDFYRPSQQGKISIALASDWYEPLSGCESDVYAAETKLEFQLGWWAHPIYLGDYPPRMIERIRLQCEYDDIYHTRLPMFTVHEIEYIKDTHDFFSLNYNSAFYVTTAPAGYYTSTCYESDIGVELLPCEGDFLNEGIRHLIRWITYRYYKPAIFITSDGYGDESRDLVDDKRIDWIKGILKNVRLAMIEDDCRVYGYSYYSYIDGFEWIAGYTLKYGLYDVDFECPQKTRTPRKSASYYQHLCETGCINDPCPYRLYAPCE